MLTHPTLDQLRALKLDGMAQAFVELETQDEVRNLAHREWLALLLDREAAYRSTRRFQFPKSSNIAELSRAKAACHATEPTFLAEAPTRCCARFRRGGIDKAPPPHHCNHPP